MEFRVVDTASYADGSLRAALWPSAAEPPIDLGSLDGATRSSAAAINERGEIVGEACCPRSAAYRRARPSTGDQHREHEMLSGALQVFRFARLVDHEVVSGEVLLDACEVMDGFQLTE